MLKKHVYFRNKQGLSIFKLLGKGHWGGRCHRGRGRIWRRYLLRVWIAHHWICQESELEAAAVLLRHPWIRPVRGDGSVLSYDGFPSAVRLLIYLLSPQP